MSMFGNIVSALFHHASAAAPAQTAAADASPAPAASTPSADAPASAGTTSAPTPDGASAGTPPAAGAPAAPAAPVGSVPKTVDATAVLEGLAAKNPQKLDWRHSIVDMMKLLGLDSSLANRKELATELHYTGNMDDSAAMNMWLHTEVMKKLAENGGQVPADLKA